jgi:hypothetical protein
MTSLNEEKDWYEHRHELEVGDVFTTHRGHKVALEGHVMIDNINWHVVSFLNGEWHYFGEIVSPSDLKTRMMKHGDEALWMK